MIYKQQRQLLTMLKERIFPPLGLRSLPVLSEVEASKHLNIIISKCHYVIVSNPQIFKFSNHIKTTYKQLETAKPQNGEALNEVKLRNL